MIEKYLYFLGEYLPIDRHVRALKYDILEKEDYKYALKIKLAGGETGTFTFLKVEYRDHAYDKLVDAINSCEWEDLYE